MVAMRLDTEKPILKLDDVRGFALLHGQRWLGERVHRVELHGRHPWVDEQFSLLGYASKTQNPLFERGASRPLAWVSNGASRFMVPGSDRAFRDMSGVRYEYLIHGYPQDAERLAHLLLHLAHWPYVNQRCLNAGQVVTFDTLNFNEPGWAFDSVYITYPYEDDHQVYGDPDGQLHVMNLRFQVMWVIPLHPAERAFIEADEANVDVFEERLSTARPNFGDLARPSVI